MAALGKTRRRQAAEQQQQAAAGRWAGITAQWEAIPSDQVAAAHRRAAQLLVGGWGAVDWGDGSGG